MEQVTRRILLHCVFLKVRRIPSGVISAIGMRSWPISPASETAQRVLAIRGDLDSRDLVGAEMVSRKVAPICAKHIHFASHACHNLASRTPSTFYPNSANYNGFLASRVARLAEGPACLVECTEPGRTLYSRCNQKCSRRHKKYKSPRDLPCVLEY